ncbi:MAG: hypothetical protein IT443_01785 [Phycisphaeraceae bacterium]|nr:hypothetical protein [Phycisphaeraceae bacterium]
MNSGITQDVFELVLARPVREGAGEHMGMAHLWWRAPQQGNRLVQVYVDGRLYDVSSDPQERQMWLTCPRQEAHRIELLAVPADRADLWGREHPRELRGWSPAWVTEARLDLIRDERLPVDSRMVVRVDGRESDEGLLWAGDENRGGFGLLFGLGAFGHDAAGGLGLGLGELGMGPLGVDGQAWHWRRTDLAGGGHALEVVAQDAGGYAASRTLASEEVIDTWLGGAQEVWMKEDFTLAWR